LAAGNKAGFYRYVAAFDEAGLGKALAPCVDQIGRELLRQCAEKTATTGIDACFARAASGRVIAAPPRMAMKSRRFMS